MKVCESCRHFAADAETTCPECGTSCGASHCKAPWPRHHLAGEEFDRGPARAPVGRAERLLVLGTGLVALAVGVAAVVWVVQNGGREGPGKEGDGSGRIRVGMHISEVGRILDRGPAPSPSYPRMRDYFPADELGNGTIDYEGDNIILKIGFVRGWVTSVEESPSSAGPGFHHYRMIVRER